MPICGKRAEILFSPQEEKDSKLLRQSESCSLRENSLKGINQIPFFCA